ncbi:unnamed protein product [Oikopleura dioica]|uniref:Importin N-terminal domain-containing protein n=2 Tax=Oikopleura dioica TaxID=34765 RepID=E4WVD5_OIKDI|nr:unnamed protein product [Oikopleura dioica]
MSQGFYELLAALSSEDNGIRSQAEDKYASINGEQKLQVLLPAIADVGLSDTQRLLGAVLLRRTITVQWDDCWQPLSANETNNVKSSLLGVLNNLVFGNVPINVVVTRKLVDAIAELARRLLEDAAELNAPNHVWPEILQFLFQCAQSEHVDVALNLILNCPSIFGPDHNKYGDNMRELLVQSMGEDKPMERRGLAVKVVCNLVIEDPDSNIVKSFQSILPQLIATVGQYSVQEENPDVLQAIVEIQETLPKFMKPATVELLQVTIQIAENRDVNEDIRTMAVESCVTLGESLPGQIRKKAPQAIEKLCLVCLQMMMEIDDDPEWAAQTVPEDDDEDLPNVTVVGESSLDRIARSLGGNTVLKCIAPQIAEFLKPEKVWQEKRAALLALSAIAEGTAKSIKSILPDLVPAMLPYLQDDHPRVRHAACNCVGQLSTDLSPEMQKMFHSEILQNLVPVLDDQCTRVRTHAGAALVNFIDDAPKSVLMPYLEPLCQKLAAVLQQHLQSTGPFMVLEQLCTTVAAVADKIEKDFSSQYDLFMPNLMSLLKATENAKVPENEDLRLLRGKAIECVSLIGLAVGKEHFLADGHGIMKQLVNTQQDINSWSDDDPQISYMISAWARLCQILGDEFHQYLPLVMGPLMKAARFQPQVKVVDPDDEEKEDDENWEFVNLGGGQSFGIASAGLEEKSTACSMLVCYVKELGGKFGDYVEEVATLMIPLLKFYFFDAVRCSAAQAIGPLISATAESKGLDAAIELWKHAFAEILSALEAEPENEIVGFLFGAIAEVSEILGKNFLGNEENTAKVFEYVGNRLTEHIERSNTRIKARTDDDYDDEVEEDLQVEDEEDSFVLNKISDVFHSSFGLLGGALLPFFEKFMKDQMVELIKPQRVWSDRQWGLCLWDDIIEFCGEESWQYSDLYLQALARGINDQQPEVRQAASYGVGILGKCGPQAAQQMLGPFVEQLAKVIEGPLGRGGENPEQVEATENAISAVAKILQHRPNTASLEDWLERFLTWLPVCEDTEESVNTYSFLANLLEYGNATAHAHTNRIIYLLTEALTSGGLEEDEEAFERVKRICGSVKDGNRELWNAVLGQVNLDRLPADLKN